MPQVPEKLATPVIAPGGNVTVWHAPLTVQVPKAIVLPLAKSIIEYPMFGLAEAASHKSKEVVAVGDE